MTRWGTGRRDKSARQARERNRHDTATGRHHRASKRLKRFNQKNRRPRNRGNQAAEANRTARGNRDRIAGEPNSNSERAAARERHDMIGSKQIGIPPAAANRPLARSSLARGRGNNSSRPPEKSRQEGVGRKGKREQSHPIAFALSNEMDDIDYPSPARITQPTVPLRKQARQQADRRRDYRLIARPPRSHKSPRSPCRTGGARDGTIWGNRVMIATEHEASSRKVRHEMGEREMMR